MVALNDTRGSEGYARWSRKSLVLVKDIPCIVDNVHLELHDVQGRGRYT